MQLDLSELRELLAALDRTDISELTLKSGDFELTVRKGTGAASDALRDSYGAIAPGTQHASRPPSDLAHPSGGASASPAAPYQMLPTATPDVSTPSPDLAARGTTQPGASAPASGNAAVPPLDKKWVDVISPMVGTFYRAPAPDEPPFVSVGDRLTVGQTVCIIEAMKLMNEIEAEVSGRVMEISIQNGQPVEYGQVLMRIDPD